MRAQLLLPREVALIILAPTHEIHRKRLLPRTAGHNLAAQALPPGPPPFDELRVAGVLGEGDTRVGILRLLRPQGVEEGGALYGIVRVRRLFGTPLATAN